MAKHFATTRLGSVSDPGRWDRSIPTLLLANHTNWWDGPLALVVAHELGLVAHVLMEAVNLERYPAFRLAGALPIRRDSPRAAVSDLMAVRACLRPATGVWIFPQGARRPQGERPTRFERGPAALALAYRKPIRVCPVALRYIYLSEQLPEAFVWLGPPRVVEPGEFASRRELAPVLEQDLLATIDVLDGLLRTESVAAFRTIVAGRLSINKRMDRFRHAVGLLRGPFEARNG
ncbi:MAG TPA: lysophospholipid acyltransferase family protein [Gemmatimonadales bacterium]|jgi:1-acyl-sn-glycerol-3-phosphate acyltransferase|nr:lysophospholipid acyltransferase family protein [Gemmatimonadales bacterium]